MHAYAPKRQDVVARVLTEANIGELEKWTEGSIKGTSLPAKDRVLDIWDTFTDSELRVNMGEVIVYCAGTNRWEVFTLDQFNMLFEELIS